MSELSQHHFFRRRRDGRSPWLLKPIDRAVVLENSVLLSSPSSSSSSHGSEHGSINNTSRNSKDTRFEHESHGNDSLERHMTLFDLVSVGVGGTIGSGIFVLCGLIARNYAGPATFLSWLIAGISSLISGACYAELAGRIPTAGSTYAYAYIAMGELPAVIAAACLSLEYLVSCAAVARSWGDKVVEWVEKDLPGDHELLLSYLDPGYNMNPCAFVVSAASTILLLVGVQESKRITNFFTSTKVLLVVFMGVGGLFLFQGSNFAPFLPAKFGVSGIFRGATSSFFGFIGYDEIACLAGEAENPRTNLPRAIIVVVVFITILYMFAAIALCGMQPYETISETSGFPEAFRYNNVWWAAQVAAAGEVLTMPIIVLVGLMAQPRLLFAMAQDGLLPRYFAVINRSGNLWNGTLVSGITMIIIATCVPFNYLDDFISSGILVAFSMTASTIILMRHRSPEENPGLVGKLIGLYNIFAFLSAVVLIHASSTRKGKLLGSIFCALTICICWKIHSACPQQESFGGEASLHFFMRQGISEQEYFRVPLLPFVPCIGIFVNWTLVAQLSFSGLAMLFGYLFLAAMYYFWYGYSHSLGNNYGWGLGTHSSIPVNDDEPVLERGISLPRKSTTLN